MDKQIVLLLRNVVKEFERLDLNEEQTRRAARFLVKSVEEIGIDPRDIFPERFGENDDGCKL